MLENALSETRLFYFLWHVSFTDTVSLTLISCTRLHAARAEVDTHAVQAEVSLGQHSKTITINNYLAHLNALLGS